MSIEEFLYQVNLRVDAHKMAESGPVKLGDTLVLEIDGKEHHAFLRRTEPATLVIWRPFRKCVSPTVERLATEQDVANYIGVLQED